ncbi:MAG: hypothetical protein NC915_06800 [Candidatus Omnitrophica bacterium]|nr:hypothetical protein [Candidatus Omnitrophota bacterium]
MKFDKEIEKSFLELIELCLKHKDGFQIAMKELEKEIEKRGKSQRKENNGTKENYRRNKSR